MGETGKVIRIIAERDIPELLSMSDCIEAIDACMREVSLRNVELPLRWGLQAGPSGVMGMMPGFLGKPECFGIKLVSLFPDNAEHGLSSHSGLMTLFEPECGRPLAMLDAGYLTAMRTAAASAVATRALARRDACNVAILGTGEQAGFHARAMFEVVPDMRLTIWGRTRKKAVALAESISQKIGVSVDIAASSADAVSDAHIVCCVTSAAEPILKGVWIPPGCHVNAVGASFPDKREIDTDTVLHSRYFTDYRDSCLAQAGDLLAAIDEGLVSEGHIAGEIGEVLLGERDGRISPDDITVYRSLGVAAQDLAAAYAIYRESDRRGSGTIAEL